MSNGGDTAKSEEDTVQEYTVALLKETREELVRADTKASLLFAASGVVFATVSAGVINGRWVPSDLERPFEGVDGLQVSGPRSTRRRGADGARRSRGDLLTEERGEPVEQQAGAVLALRRILEVVEERAVLGDDEPRAIAELLLPQSEREWLPEGHLAWFVIDAVAAFDLSAFYAAYRVDGHGGRRTIWNLSPAIRSADGLRSSAPP